MKKITLKEQRAIDRRLVRLARFPTKNYRERSKQTGGLVFENSSGDTSGFDDYDALNEQNELDQAA